MGTAEFCDAYGIPHPTVRGGVEDFLTVDAIKCKIFIEYAKFLSTPLNIEMFTAEKPLFNGFIAQTEPNYVELYSGIRIYNKPGENVRLFSYVFRKDEDHPIRVENLVGKISHFNKWTTHYKYYMK